MRSTQPGLYTCQPDPYHPDQYEIIAPDGSVIDHLDDFKKVEQLLSKLNHAQRHPFKDHTL